MEFKVLITSSLNILCFFFSSKGYSKLIKLNQMGNRGMRRQRENSKRKEEPRLLFFFIFGDNTSKNQHLWKIKARTKNWYSNCNSSAKNRFREETTSTYDKVILYKFPQIVTSCELFQHRTYRSCILCTAHTEPSARDAMWICETPQGIPHP